MDYIRCFDICLEKDVYYGGETINGEILLENADNIRVRGIIVLLRGKAHAQLKVTKSGERRTIKDDQYIIDEKSVVWGKDKYEENDDISILQSGSHQFPFEFRLPQCSLPCSLETKLGTIRYYIKVRLCSDKYYMILEIETGPCAMLKVIIDVPFASSPQGIKYFTIIGPHIDCMEDKYLNSLTAQDRMTKCCWCCTRGVLAMRFVLQRTAYICGEYIRAQAQVENRQDVSVCIAMRLIQHVEYFIDRGISGENKSIYCTVLEHRSSSILPHSQGKYDSALDQPIHLPVVPTTLVGVCLEDEKGKESLHMEFPLTIGTLPYRLLNSSLCLDYDYCSSHVEGGRYISPEFRMGQVYDGQFLGVDDSLKEDETILYRPVYVKIADKNLSHKHSKERIAKDMHIQVNETSEETKDQQPNTAGHTNNLKKLTVENEIRQEFNSVISNQSLKYLLKQENEVWKSETMPDKNLDDSVLPLIV